MDAQEFSNRLQALYGNIDDFASDTILVAGAEMVDAIKVRIVDEGLNSNNSSIGSYSKKPIYASSNQFIAGGFNPQGKNSKFGNTVGDKLVPTVRTKSTGIKKNPVKYQKYTLVKPNYQQRKTMYLADGYKQLRALQGLRTDIMNMSYSGAMMADFQISQEGQVGLIGFSDELQIKKRKGQTAKRGNIFNPTENEIEEYGARSAFLIGRLTRSILQEEGITAVATIENVA